MNAIMDDASQLRELLEVTGQQHLWDHAESLQGKPRDGFLTQLRSIDWRQVAALAEQAKTVAAPADFTGIAPPAQLIRHGEVATVREAKERGEAWLRAGKVAAILVAGGQGTRLGFDHPKGMFPAGPLSGKSLFQWFCEQVRARSLRAGLAIPYAIMTSDATHDETVAYFAEHGNFGLASDQVRFFRQGNMPAVDETTGGALLNGPGELALSPDGHGGVLAALDRAGLLKDFASRGVETLYYHQVDNPTTIVCDPAFLGWHLLRSAEVSTKVVAKTSASERMGVAVTLAGVTRIIEYSDLPSEIAARVDERGELLLWAGSTAIHAFDLSFLERARHDVSSLPFHIARKAVPYWTPSTGSVTPTSPNALKFERFIFDVLPWAQRSLIVEADRADEFNPIKNREGADSPETSRAAMQALHRRWVRAAGGVIADDVPIEIGPLVALCAEDLRGRFPSKTIFTTAQNWTKEVGVRH